MNGRRSGSAWSTPADVTAALRKRWDRGEFLAKLATDVPWEPVGVPIRTPTTGDLTHEFGAVQTWAAQWLAADGRNLRVEYRAVGGRVVGSNRLPCRAWVDTADQMWALLGVSLRVRRFTELVEFTRGEAPALVERMAARPAAVLAHEADWVALVRTVRWIEAHGRPDIYVRQIDVPGVDTKFVEKHRTLLADLLDRQLPEERVDRGCPPSDFAGRYRLRRKPSYVRFRLLDPAPAPFTELTVRVEELAANPVAVSTVYVVENEVTFLAFPPVRHAAVVLGGGYAVQALAPLRWLADRRLVYWGDIDTHGFTILGRLRAAFPHVESMLMDRATLLGHRTQWVTEPAPVTVDLPQLTPAEAGVYRELVDGAHGVGVRLEQERISFSTVTEAVRCFSVSDARTPHR